MENNVIKFSKDEIYSFIEEFKNVRDKCIGNVHVVYIQQPDGDIKIWSVCSDLEKVKSSISRMSNLLGFENIEVLIKTVPMF